jgi:4-amino-4-deoxy-L-arabinose transferase-like glycosyltransferase
MLEIKDIDRALERLVDRKGMVILLSILAFAFLLRIWNIGNWWNRWWLHDEIGYLLCAANIFKNYYMCNPLFYGEIDWYLSLPAVVLVKEITGTLLITRMIRVLIGVATIPILYLFTKEFYGQKTALIAAFLIAIFPSDVFISRMAVETALALFFCTLSLYFLYKFSLGKGEKYIYLFSLTAGLGIVTHLSVVLFLMAISIPFFVFLKTRISKKSFIISFLIAFVICYTTIQFVLNDPQELFKHFDNTDLLDVKDNLFRGTFLLFPSFLGGDVRSGLVYPLNIPSPLFSVFLLIFFFFCVKKGSRKDLFLASSLLIGIVLISTLTISAFRPITFYILIPIISVAAAKGISFSYKKFGTVLLLGVFLLSIVDLFSIANEVSKTVQTFYLYCIREVVENVVKLKPSSVIVGEVYTMIKHPLEYRLYEVGQDFYNSIHDKKFDENSLVILVFSQSPSNYVNAEATEVFINEVKSSGFNLVPVKNITCDECGVSYHLYFLRR